ncbi:MAG: VOC family protein [Ginsengibacter sp.]
MSEDLHAVSTNGKVCYLEIPTMDVENSAAFYKKVFGWTIRDDNAGNISFDDSVGQVSGMWVTGRKPSVEPGVLISIMVDSAADTLKLVVENNGKVVREPEGEGEVIALFSDPAGNVFCLYQSTRS